ncbi:MAG: MaoC family dehydratase [Parvibaculum sp.]|uniref:MaoC family dehydratase n=1 Tax=Parvibaculum sp. TaxID=2024848 RepID=UPI003C721C0B
MTDLATAPEGAMVGSITADRITRHMLALYCGASGDHNPIHVDIDFAKSAGMPDVFAHGMLSMAFLGRLLTDLAPQSVLRSFGTRFATITHLGAEITCTAKLVERFVADDERRVRLELVASDQSGDVKLLGEAVLALQDQE